MTAIKTPRRKPPSKGADSLFTLDVFLISGPLTEAYVQANRSVCRTIQIRGSQTLHTLHEAIFDAFDREEEHLYEFQVGGEGPMDPKARRYGLPGSDDLSLGGAPVADATETPVGSVGLKVGDAFGYWFDFGDDWWHQINVVSIEDKVPSGRYPKVIKRQGESPPQYPDWDNEP